MSKLQLQLLGHFQLLINGAPVSIPQARLQSLLAYFFLHRHSARLRQHIAFTFWPDSTEAQARNNLRKALYDLRQMIPDLERYLQVDGPEQEEVSIDVSAFEELVAQAAAAKQPTARQAAMEQALLLYIGDFLPASYEEWVLSERERLRQHYLHLLEQLVYLLEERRDYTTAALHAQRLLQADPLRESAYRALMRLHLQNGDRALALRVYHTCATHLQQELGVEPSAETQAAYRSLLNLEATPAHPPAAKGRSALIGRRQEWNTLLKEWRGAFQGQSHFALIAGEAGIGKTRLVEEILLWAEQQGYATARTRSYAAEGQLAYAPVADWLRAADIRNRLSQLEPVWLSEIARLLPELLVERFDLPPPQPLTDSWQRQRFREALARALIIGKQPLLLVMDDLQWCDRETLEWLHYLLRFAATAQLLIVGTVRPEEIGADHPLTTLLINLRQEGKVSEVELGPLDGDETAQLAAIVAGHELNANQVTTLYAETEGHPLFVVETIRARESGIRAISPTQATDLPPKVQAIIGSRLLQLTPTTRELMGVAAVVGRAFNVFILAEAGAIEDEALARALDELWQRRIIREQGESAYDFSHDRIRDAAYAAVSPPRRRLLHRRVAEALEHLYIAELDAISGQIAAHYELSGLHEQAILFYQRAAEVAQRVYAHTDAASLLTTALKLLSSLPSNVEHLRLKLKLQLSLGVSLMTIKGMSSLEVRELYQQTYATALQVGDERGQLAAMVALHITLVTTSDFRAAYKLSQYEIALAERVGNPSRLLEARAQLGIVLLNQGKFQASRSYLEQIVNDADYQWTDPSHPVPVMHLGLSTGRQLTIALWNLGYPDHALQLSNKLLALARQLAHPFSLAAVLLFRARLHYNRREAPLAQVWAEDAINFIRQQEMVDWLDLCMAVRAWVLVQQGQITAGLASIQESLDLHLTREDFGRYSSLLPILAESYCHAGMPEQAVYLLDRALASAHAVDQGLADAELYRLKAEALRMQGASEEEIEANLLHSLAIARQQEAKSPELRTATFLARLWQQQGKRRQAYDLLAPIYEWFTEGFDTPDLIEAKALLETLS